jgi:acid phosphatase (class A)
MSVKPFALPLILAAIGAAGVSAAKEAEPPRFLTADEIQAAIRLPPPPPEGSDRQKAELSELHRLERETTPERLAQAKADGANETAALFAPALGPGFDLSKLPAASRMLEEVHHEEKLAASAGKAFWRRPRPVAVDPTLDSCSKSEKPGTSYPSGHATLAWSMATVLAAAWPAKAPAIMARAQDYAESRVICGVHFRSDIEAGQRLGEEVGKDLLANPAFRAEEEAAAQELKSVQ